ncbi:MAG: hypothetical protein ABII09_05795 [Planctomycetota bacterium]
MSIFSGQPGFVYRLPVFVKNYAEVNAEASSFHPSSLRYAGQEAS